MHRKPRYTDPIYSHKSTHSLRPGADDYKSLNSCTSKPIPNECASCAVDNKYSGHLLVGIATMHKSNAVPITRNSGMAEAVAKMRRG